MDALPSFEQLFAVFRRLGEQTPHVGFLDAYAEHKFRRAIRPNEVDLRVPITDDMDMGWLVIGRVYHEAEAASTVHDDRDLK